MVKAASPWLEIMLSSFHFLFCVIFLVYPAPCLDGCVCYYSVGDEANTVDCSNRNLTSFLQKILPQTEQIIYSGNNIEILDSVTISLVSVSKIDLQRNNIQSITEEVLAVMLSGVYSLNLSGNKFQKLSRKQLETNYQTQLWLADNPYDCNCDMMWMRDWLQLAGNVRDSENMTCGAGKWRGEYLLFFNIISFLVRTETHSSKEFLQELQYKN